jgi:hypothetical protein
MIRFIGTRSGIHAPQLVNTKRILAGINSPRSQQLGLPRH